jgi:1-deoxy-D-xylulose-5-phosphate synthase
LEEGKDILLLGAGFMTNELKKTAKVLRENGKSATVVDARVIKPLDTEAYRKLFEGHKTIVTLEDNTLVGGFGSAVAELIADLGLEGKRLLRFGLPDHFVEQGEIPALFKLLKIDGESVAKQIMEKV